MINFFGLNPLDCNPEDVPIYTGHSLFNTTKRITLLFIIQSLLDCNQTYIWIEVIQIGIQIKCLHRTKFINPDPDLDNFAPCKRGIRVLFLASIEIWDKNPYSCNLSQEIFIVHVPFKRKFNTLPCLLDSQAALSNSYPNACVQCSLYHLMRNFGMTRPGCEPTTKHMRGRHAYH